MKRLAFAFLFVLLLNCPAFSDEVIQNTYNKPGDSVQRYENERISIETGIGNLESGLFAMHGGQFVQIKITNKTSSPFLIDWNNVSIIDTNGIARRILMSDTPYINRANPIPASTVPPTATILKHAIPLDYVHGPGAHNVDPFIEFPLRGRAFDVVTETNVKSKAYQKFMQKYNLKTFGYFIPVTFQDGVENYTIMHTFDFSDILAASAIDEAPTEETEVIIQSGITSIGDNNTIASIESGGIAERAGLQVGDRILEINGRAPSVDIIETINPKIAAGSTVMILYERNGVQNMATLKAE